MTLTLKTVSGRTAVVVILALATLVPALIPETGYATKYGVGKYGRCQYQTCAISLASGATVSTNVTPATTGTTCSVSSNTVTVTTSSSTGYLLTLIDGDTSTNLVSGSNTIPTTSGTYSSPATLTANTWGYRVDGQGNFGAGPTSTLASGAVPTVTFAKLQPSSGTADTLVNSSVAATNGTSASVWYGVCVTAAQASGSYSDSVLYTAIVN